MQQHQSSYHSHCLMAIQLMPHYNNELFTMSSLPMHSFWPWTQTVRTLQLDLSYLEWMWTAVSQTLVCLLEKYNWPFSSSEWCVEKKIPSGCLYSNWFSTGGCRSGAHAWPPPSPLELSKCKTRRFTAHLAYIATPTQRIAISIWIDASCPANIKHSNLQLPIKRQFCGSAKNTKVDSKGMGLQETTNKMNRLSDTPVAINFVWLW